MDAITFPALIAYIDTATRDRRCCTVANHNLHSIYLVQRDREMRDFYASAQLIYIDGMPLVQLARLLGFRVSRGHRITFIDRFENLMQEADFRRWRVFYLGSRPGVAARGADLLLSRRPNLQICTHHGYFDHQPDSAENQSVLRMIRDFEPHLLMVGMGMPLQERWLNANFKRLPPCVAVTCGATMDYFTGEIATPPRWSGVLGLYWLFRLFDNPSRLWRRYLVEPWTLLPLLIREFRRRGRQVQEPAVSREAA